MLTVNHVYKTNQRRDYAYLFLGITSRGKYAFIVMSSSFLYNGEIRYVEYDEDPPEDEMDYGIHYLCDFVDVTESYKMPEWYNLFVEMIANDLMEG